MADAKDKVDETAQIKNFLQSLKVVENGDESTYEGKLMKLFKEQIEMGVMPNQTGLYYDFKPSKKIFILTLKRKSGAFCK